MPFWIDCRRGCGCDAAPGSRHHLSGWPCQDGREMHAGRKHMPLPDAAVLPDADLHPVHAHQWHERHLHAGRALGRRVQRAHLLDAPGTRGTQHAFAAATPAEVHAASQTDGARWRHQPGDAALLLYRSVHLSPPLGGARVGDETEAFPFPRLQETKVIGGIIPGLL